MAMAPPGPPMAPGLDGEHGPPVINGAVDVMNAPAPKPKTRSEFPETWLWINEGIR